MMMFALSKINLLILVVALFTIIVYFTFGFQGLLAVNSANQEVRKVVEQVAFLINSPNICRSIEISIPDKIMMASGQGMFFVMEIRTVELENRNSLIFSIIDRDILLKAQRKGKEPTIVASERFNLRATFHLFSLDEEDNLCLAESTYLGLGSRDIPIDNAVVVKERYHGETFVYLIPCTSASNTSCEENAQRVACWVKEQRGGTMDAESNCFDTPDTCASPVLAGCPAVS